MAQQIPNGTRFIGIATSVDLVERKSAVLNKTTEPYTIEDIASSVSLAAEGPQGPPGVQGEQGIPGTAGAVGPAGLTWRGSWVSGTSYVANNAVGYNGASWFCILATSGTTNPSADATHWALLASQGAQGIQGIQGIQGLQGIQGIQGPASAQNLQQTVDLGNSINSSINVNNGGYVLDLNSSSVRIEQQGTGVSSGFFHDKITLGNSGYLTTLKPAATLTADRNILLPNASGTIALLSDIPSGTVPTLQEVVGEGNTVSGGSFIRLQNGPAFSDLQPGDLSVYDSANIVDVYPGSILFSKQIGDGSVELKFSNTTDAVRVITLPNATGTVALKQFSTYVATLQFGSDGSPLENIAFSDIVDGISYTQTGTGIYNLGSTGKFTANKTIITPFAYQGSTTDSGAVRLPIYSSNAIVGYYWLQRINTNDVRLYVVDSAQAPVNPYTLLGTRKLTIDIKVYN
jgi:hypothetical protein